VYGIGRGFELDRVGFVALGTLEDAREFRTVAGNRRARVEQPVCQPVQQTGIGPLGQLEFPLAPPLLGFLVALGLGHDVVVAELRHCGAVRRIQHVDSARGRDARDRADRAIAHDRQHDVQQFLRNGVAGLGAERRSHLGPGIRPCGQFDMPAGVGAPGTAAQGHTVGGEIVGRCVEVDGIELLRRRTLHAGDRRQPLE